MAVTQLLPQLLDGLKAFEIAARGAEPLARAAALAFAFVYIHPMPRYDRTLDVFSRPFMQRYAASYRFGELVINEHSTASNLIFDDYADAQFAWRYTDLTERLAGL